ncbi:hypothetical protein GJ744_001706 [Endocarpon pusillum]|uniref:NADH-ubiquinone oxidoreductase n=1 Tax=Endocarpon pusillum TaxID=364733 RepID=A0A8H7A9Q2_9EURO|nr:hypothetical protein GJ744_001706 [Endocarpon pusillum]
MARREPQFNQTVLIDPTPMPEHIPKVEEIGASSAPLMKAYGRGELECMKEGRKVTRCAASVLKDINQHCLDEFRQNWNCLDNHNHQMWQCRRSERVLNRCVFEKIGLQKVIPDTPKGDVPVHLRDKQLFANRRSVLYPGESDVGVLKERFKSEQRQGS